MAPEPTRHFVQVEGRQVHYARAGAGPAIALLHGSPQSHRALLPLIRHLAPRLTVFAFDTLGYGASDPLPGHPDTLAPFADALIATFRALGLGPLPVYGTHTGAGIALEAANRYPEAVTRAVLDGFGIWSAAEQEDMLREYLPTYPPQWDGSHLVALWSRARDSAAFFPFFRLGSSARRKRIPKLAAIHQATMDMLHAGDGYRVAYAASIRHDSAALTVDPARVRLVCRTDDMLLSHLDRLPPDFPREHARAVDDAAWLPAITAYLAEAAVTEAPAPPPPSPARTYSGTPSAQVHVRTIGGGPGRPLALFHANPGASTSQIDLAATILGRPILLPDSPGSGLSDPAANPVEAATRLAAALPTDAARAGFGTGAILAGLINNSAPVAIIDPPEPGWPDHQPFDAAPDWAGGHLLAAWYRHRDALLHRPWFDRRPENALPLAPVIDLAALHARTIETLDEVGPELCRALLQLTPRGDIISSGPGLAARLAQWQGT